MVNVASELAASHPEWLLQVPVACPSTSAISRCSTSRTRARSPTSSSRSSPSCASTASTTSSGTTTATSWTPAPPVPVAPASTSRPSPPIDFSTPSARPAAARDRIVLVGRGPGRSRDPRPHRPGLGVRLHRRSRATADPAVDVAAASPRAGGQPRRGRPRPHDPSPSRPRLPGGDRSVRAFRHRVGPHDRLGGRGRAPRRVGRLLQGRAGAPAHRHDRPPHPRGRRSVAARPRESRAEPCAVRAHPSRTARHLARRSRAAAGTRPIDSVPRHGRRTERGCRVRPSHPPVLVPHRHRPRGSRSGPGRREHSGPGSDTTVLLDVEALA